MRLWESNHSPTKIKKDTIEAPERQRTMCYRRVILFPPDLKVGNREQGTVVLLLSSPGGEKIFHRDGLLLCFLGEGY